MLEGVMYAWERANCQCAEPEYIKWNQRKIDPSGMMMLVKASDGQPIQVKLQQPLQGNVEGIVEIHGIGQSRQVMCQNYVSFPLEYSASFDMQGYDQAVRLIHSVPGNPWKFD
ncbi:replication protein A 14 kDa subunit-like isoform X2 [Panulirus ornatus]|uniref:replication protein A 14 kDa subunit-like isoform X2 n=1 Tax=Panulirus ornatus TaxID=150431 RepID=UPI003A8B618B